MIETLPEGLWKTNVIKLRDDTAARLTEVSNIIESTLPQLPDSSRMTAALDRIKQKEK